MTEDMIRYQYKMLLRFSYGDRERLIAELNAAIDLYRGSPNWEYEKCQKRIAFYNAIIDMAIQEKNALLA